MELENSKPQDLSGIAHQTVERRMVWNTLPLLSTQEEKTPTRFEGLPRCCLSNYNCWSGPFLSWVKKSWLVDCSTILHFTWTIFLGDTAQLPKFEGLNMTLLPGKAQSKERSPELGTSVKSSKKWCFLEILDQGIVASQKLAWSSDLHLHTKWPVKLEIGESPIRAQLNRKPTF